VHIHHPDMEDWGRQSIDTLEARFNEIERYQKLSTDELADFWQGMTEACLLRLTRLKPEAVTKATE